jgi:flagellin
LGTSSNAVSTALSFTSNLSDALTTGVGNLVDADVAAESATLQALQTKQQLGVQALSIANSSTSVLLSLFHGG